MSSIKYSVNVTDQAKEQIKQIVQYIQIELQAPDAANNWTIILEDKMNSLSFMPHRFQRIEEEPWKSYGIRKMEVRSYYVYFWIDEENFYIQIISVIYSKRDQVNQLNNLKTLNTATYAMQNIQSQMRNEAEKAGLTTEEEINKLVKKIRSEI